jgi:hypothetical protein
MQVPRPFENEQIVDYHRLALREHFIVAGVMIIDEKTDIC